MIRLLLALFLLGALGHFVRWAFTRRFRGLGSSASVQGTAGSAPVSTSRKLITSAALSVLIGGGVVLVLFVGKLVYFELTRSAAAESSAIDFPRTHA